MQTIEQRAKFSARMKELWADDAQRETRLRKIMKARGVKSLSELNPLTDGNRKRGSERAALNRRLKKVPVTLARSA